MDVKLTGSKIAELRKQKQLTQTYATLSAKEKRQFLSDMLPPLSHNGLKWGLLSQET